MRSGLESFYEATQLDLGEIAVTLPTPSALTHERAIVFVAFNAVFSSIAMSKPFHVTDERGRLLPTGEVISTGGACVGFRDVDGFAYELLGATAGLQSDEDVSLEAGFVAESSYVDGATIRVFEVSRTP